MAITEKQRAAQKARDDYRRVRAQRVGPAAELEPLEVLSAISEDPDGLIHINNLNTPLSVKIPGWDNYAPDPQEQDEFWLEWKFTHEAEYTRVFEETIPGSPAGPAFPLTREIPVAHFSGREGRAELRYTYVDWNSGQENHSPTVPVTFDRTAPWHPNPVPPIIIAAPVITDQSLGNDNGVLCKIPETPNPEPGAFVAVGWFDQLPELVPDQPAFYGLLPANREIVIPRSVVESFGSGTHYVSFVLFDKAGNRSEMSLPIAVQVALGELPDGLQAPRVPLAEPPENLIDRRDAATPVTVEIDVFDHYLIQDRVYMQGHREETERHPSSGCRNGM